MRLGSLAIVLGLLVPLAARAQDTEWESGLASALARAVREDRPVFVDFHATWCGPCKYLQKTTFRDSAFIRFAGEVVCAKIDAERETESARRYGVDAYPTLLLLRKDGVELERVVGVLPTHDLVTLLREGAAGRPGLEAMLAAEDSFGRDPEFLMKLGDRLALHGRADDAARRYRRLMVPTIADSTGYPARAGLGIVRAYQTARRPTAAIAAARSWLERFPADPRRADILLLLAQLHRTAGDDPASRAAYRTFLSSFPDDPRTAWAREYLNALR